MGTIRTKPTKDLFGKGNEKEVIIDNKRYTIRSTPTKDLFGDGNEQEIVYNGPAHSAESDFQINKWCAFAIILLILSVAFAFKRHAGNDMSAFPQLCFIGAAVLFVISCIVDFSDCQNGFGMF